MIKFANEKKAVNELREAMQSGDESRIQAAWENFHNSVAEAIRQDFEEIKAANDETVLIQRGYRRLTSRETNWYNKVIDALKSNTPKQAFAQIIGTDEEDGTMPETILEDVYKDLTQEYPILNALNFQHVRYMTRWILNDHTVQKAVWGEITEAIIKEITSAFKIINVNQNKLSAYAAIERGMLDLGPVFLDGYIRAVLKEAMACGLEDGIINGNGLNAPIGMVKDISEGVSVSQTTGYPDKEAIAVTQFDAASYGGLLAKLAMTEKGRPRKFAKVALAVSMPTYLSKVLAATRVQGADGKYTSYLDSIFPTDFYICNSVPADKAVLFIPKEYYLLIGGTKNEQIEISDEYKFLEDFRYFKIKQYGTGRAFDNTCCLLLDISGLQPAVIAVKHITEAAAAAVVAEDEESGDNTDI